MGITLTQIAGNTAHIKLAVGDAYANIDYYPAQITEKLFAQLNSFGHLGGDPQSVIDGFGTLNEILVSLIKSWDIYEDDAQTKLFPLDVERLADLPFTFRVGILNAILGDMRPEA